MLLGPHRTLVERSGIDFAYANDVRGYRTVTKRQELADLGFAASQRLVPALVVPIFNVHGEVALYQARPDRPRVVDGKAIKYETPSGAQMIVDVPPPVRPKLGDPEVPLFITEGVRKADAAALRGLACVALMGVWNWRGGREGGGKLVLPCWDSIALKGRKTYVVFDSDVMEKLPVHNAMARLKAFLEQRGASVRLVYLPPGKDASKTGLDDYLAPDATRGAADLIALSSSEIKAPPLDVRSEGKRIEHPLDSWTELDGKVVEAKATEDGGERYEARLDGIARLVRVDRRWQEDEEKPGGWTDETRLTYRVDVAGGGQLVRVVEPGPLAFLKLLEDPDVTGLSSCHRADDRSKLYQWVHRQSADAERVEVRRGVGPHGELGWLCPPGWQVVGGKLEEAPFEVEAAQAEDLKRFRFAELDDERFRAVARWVVEKLLPCDFSDRALTLPLLGAFLSAPVAYYMPALESWQRYAFFVQGPSGVGKSQVCRYFASFWGDFLNPKGLATWLSTAAYIEDLLYRAVAAPIFVSDWKLSNFDHGELKRSLKLLQAYGDRTARGRCSSSAEAQAKKPPRCTLVIDGEDLPEKEQSTLGRMVVIEVQGSDEHKGLCAEASEKNLDPAMVRDLPGLTARWVAWVQRSVGWLEEQLPGVLRDLDRRLAVGSTNRARVVRNYTIQALTVLAFQQFLEDEAEVACDLHTRSLEVHVAAANRQLGAIVGEAAGEQFLDGLRAVLWGGLARVRSHDITAGQLSPFGEVASAQAPTIGTYDRDTLYLWPAVALPVVQAHVTRGGGGRIEFSKAAILQQLEQAGIVTTGGKRPRQRGGGPRHRSWEISLGLLINDSDE